MINSSTYTLFPFSGLKSAKNATFCLKTVYNQGLLICIRQYQSVVDRTGPDLPDLPDRFGIRFGSVWYFPQIPNRTFLMKCVPKWYLRLDFTFKSSKVAIFFGQISEISFQSHLIFIIQSFRNFEAGYIWKFICYEVRFGKVRFGLVKITGPVRFGKSGICLVRSTTVGIFFCNWDFSPKQKTFLIQKHMQF